ncbi:MAG TPA: transposase [Candidatus Deferrimicrobium sp.]|nr:transposase [Candidatus Deferrimicrobium sp.]
MALIQTLSISGTPFKMCPICGEFVKFRYRSNLHEFQTLTGILRTKTCYYACENNHWFHRDNPYVFPYKKFGKNVYALIVYLRYNKRFTLKEIQAHITQKYQFTINDETIRSIIQLYQVLNHEFIPEEAHAQIRANGGVVLAIDALEPTKGADPLYTIRDVLTNTILATEFIYSASEQVLVDFFTRFKARATRLGISIIGIISDKHRGQEQALDQVFPDVPKQLCIYHFFKAAAYPAINWDRHLTTQLRKQIRKDYYIQQLKKSI